MLGAFAGLACMTLLGFPFWLAMPCAAAGMALFGMALERLVIRPILGQPAFSIIMLTIGVGYTAPGLITMIPGIGTETYVLPVPVQFEKNVINFFPVTAAREMYEPFNKLKYSFAATYYDQMKTAVPKLVKEKNARKVCSMYQDDDFGLEVQRGATDFSSQIAKLKAAGCDLVVLGTSIRETIGGIGTARKTHSTRQGRQSARWQALLKRLWHSLGQSPGQLHRS